MVNLDGSTGEGGGQMLRTALVWSLATMKPFRMTNLRAGRKDPGLKTQHVRVLESLRLLGPVQFTGATVGSDRVTFAPAPLRGTSARIDIGTAGSITLLLQTVLPAALLAEGASRLEIVGGTDVQWSPPFDYLREVVLPSAGLGSDDLTLDVLRRGFYPPGGGRVVLQTRRDAKRPGRFRVAARPEERGALERIRILSYASESLRERQVAERLTQAAARRLRACAVPVEESVTYGDAPSAGCVLTCVAHFAGGARLGGSALGERGTPAEKIGELAADRLLHEMESDGCVDEYAADQLIVWLALAGGVVLASEISEHTRTNIWVTEEFLGRVFEIEGKRIRCLAPFVPPSIP